MSIIIQDDTYKDMTNLRLLPRLFLPKFVIENDINDNNSNGEPFIVIE